MIFIYKDRLIQLEWSIFRGTSQVPEDFSRALVKLFLVGNYEKYAVPVTAEGGTLVAQMPQDLPDGAYSLEAIWVKNYNNLFPVKGTGTPTVGSRNIRYPGPCHNDYGMTHPWDHRSNDRCLMRSRKDYVFAVTSCPGEETAVNEDSIVTIRINSAVATYGYDGLSAYELAVMRGDFNGTEGEYLEQLKYELKVATDKKLGGITASEKTDGDTVEVKIDPKTGKLYVPPSEAGEIEVATETTLGGIKAAEKTEQENVEVKIDSKTGKLYTKSGNNPDDEDLHLIEREDKQVLQFADKEYNASSFSGLGRVYLRKNISGGKNVLTQAMMSKANTRYVIQYDYDLTGETITVPEGCTLEFQEGSFSNGSIMGSYTCIKSGVYNIFKNDISLSGTWDIDSAFSEWFYSSDDDSVSINKCISAFNICVLLNRTYSIKNSINITNNCTLKGVSKKAGILVTGTIEGGAIRAIGNTVTRGIVLKNFILNNSEGNTCDIGIYLQGFSHASFILDIDVYGFNYAGIYITKCWYAKFDNIQAWNSMNNLVLESNGVGESSEGGQVNAISFTNCWFNHPMDDDSAHNIIISNSGFDISFNNCTIENNYGTEASCKIEKQWSSVTFLDCYFENSNGNLISYEPNYPGAGCLNLFGGHYNNTKAIALLDIGNINKLVILGSHIGYFQNKATYSIISEAKTNFIFRCESGFLENAPISATGVVFGDFGNDYNNPAFNGQASRWSTPDLRALAKGAQGELTIGRMDTDNMTSGITQAHFKIPANDWANNLSITLDRLSDGEIVSKDGINIAPTNLGVTERMDYGKISTKSVTIGNHHYSTVDNNLFYQMGMSLYNSTGNIYDESATIFVNVRNGSNSERKNVIAINRDRVVRFIDKNGNILNSDGTLTSKVTFVTDKSQITGTAKIFKILGDIDLGGESITIPENSILDFQGGKITNGKVVLWKTKVLPMGCNISDYITATIQNQYAEGQILYDPSLKKMKLYNGTDWVNLDGTALE